MEPGPCAPVYNDAEVAFRTARNVWFGDLRHRDGGLHPGRSASLLEEVLEWRARKFITVPSMPM
jgi:hypothetical protein